MAGTTERGRDLQPGRAAATLSSVLPLVIGIAAAYVLHTYVKPRLDPFYAKVLLDIGINVILAVSLSLVNGFTGQFSIGHAGFMAVGGYTAATITYYGSHRLWGNAQFHGGFLSWTQANDLFEGTWLGGGDLLFPLACLAGGLVAAGMGYVVGLPSLRLRGDYLAIVTLGFGEIVRVIIQRTDDVLYDAEEIQQAGLWTCVTHVGGALGFTGLPFYTSLFWTWLFVAITLIVAYRLKESTHGRAFLSIREDEIAAEAMGIVTTSYKVRAFVLSAFFAGVAGSLFAHQVGTTLNPRELGFQKSFDIVIMVVLGGMGSISGSVLAAVVLTVLPEVLRTFSEYRMIVYALLLILMMILRPQGLLGLRELWDAWASRRRPKATGAG
ncbi:MAG: hypothetical protein CHACPFDD_01383 [Phycisphaerae bacterium]|nr:hypothetical protein [Phycisphaerae bacterium]